MDRRCLEALEPGPRCDAVGEAEAHGFGVAGHDELQSDLHGLLSVHGDHGRQAEGVGHEAGIMEVQEEEETRDLRRETKSLSSFPLSFNKEYE